MSLQKIQWKQIIPGLSIFLVITFLGLSSIQKSPMAPPSLFFEGPLGSSLFFVLHILGLYFVAKKKATGWALFATSYYIFCFTLPPSSARVILCIISGFCLWTYYQWKTERQ